VQMDSDQPDAGPSDQPLMPDGDVLPDWLRDWSEAWSSRAELCPGFVDDSFPVALGLFEMLRRIEATISILEPTHFRAGIEDFFGTFTCDAVWSLEVPEGGESGMLRLEEAHLRQSCRWEPEEGDYDGSPLVETQALVWLYAEVAGEHGEGTSFFSRGWASVYGNGDSDRQEALGDQVRALTELFEAPDADDPHESSRPFEQLIGLGEAYLDQRKGRVRDPSAQTYPSIIGGFETYAQERLRPGGVVGPAAAAENDDDVQAPVDDPWVAEALDSALEQVGELEEMLLALQHQPSDGDLRTSAVTAWNRLDWSTTRRRARETSQSTKFRFVQRIPHRFSSRAADGDGDAVELLTFVGSVSAEGSCRARQPLALIDLDRLFEGIGQPDPAVFEFSLEVNLDEQGSSVVTVWEPLRSPSNERAAGELLGSCRLSLPTVSNVLRLHLNEVLAGARILKHAFDLPTQTRLLLSQVLRSADFRLLRSGFLAHDVPF
jgi:hypothetical protein